ncbi:MAG: translational GTPase TypA [Rhodospirillales bacterium]|jgi:GTP-binding protein|nr:translational GTPase TypA [Rhodospirillales bacterium]MBT5521805.1 translational GTPase TypA [Rhodospirillales bacterium]MBT6109436.1 translational GTPase TypA [Rhodospirillales bacterium]MBT6827087.1 translational GTPase TypA [Rhodospirillales bacterium]MBT7146672.1 translational GTPase TypA [Rhodospirillales bacterium]
MTELRNIAIIAHVDHGKTTMVDELLRQSGAFRDNQQVAERAMDSNDLERERGITILAKCTSVERDGIRINIVDTPGHADFGGEVERILSMVDGVLLLVDASEGAMPQTKFVTTKALQIGLKPILVINKVDKPDARPYEVQDEVFDLFSVLDATDEQLDFPTVFASAKQGWAAMEPDTETDNMDALFDVILKHVKPPVEETTGAFSMLATMLDANPFLGRVLTGRIHSGTVKVNTPIKALNRDGEVVETGRISKLLSFRDLERVPVDEAGAGDLVAIAGLTKATVADTLCDISVTEPLYATPIDPPTLAMTFSVNDSPLAGTEGSKVTSRVIRDRLLREAEGNVAIRITETDAKDAFDVAGRGELQLGVLIETMRREGFELSISRPRVLFRDDPETGKTMEPIEEAVIDVDEEYSGVVVESMSNRKAEMQEMLPAGGGKVRITFLAPSRGLIGYHGQFLTETRGTGIMNRVFHSYAPTKGPIDGRRNGVLISNSPGKTVAYSLWNLEERGTMFVGSGAKAYAGMIIGENARPGDLEVNPMKAKQLTNIRASGTDENIRLTPPRKMSLEQALAYIGSDELVEVTPETIRLRKYHLDPHERKRASRAESAA